MKFKVDEAQAEAKTRVIALHMALTGLRIFEERRRVVDKDIEKIMIMMAVTAITSEHLARSDARESFDDLRQALPDDQIAPCNVSSVAAAIGLPRETTRRKIQQLIRSGALRRTDNGTIALNGDAYRTPAVYEMIRRQAGEIARIASVFSEHGIIVPIGSQNQSADTTEDRDIA